VARTVEKIYFESDILMLVRLKGKQGDICIIQVYMPTRQREEEADNIYDMIEHLLDTETRGSLIL